MEEGNEVAEALQPGAEQPEVVGVQAQRIGQRVIGLTKVVLSNALEREVESVRDCRRGASPLVEGLRTDRKDDEAADRIERPVVARPFGLAEVLPHLRYTEAPIIRVGRGNGVAGHSDVAADQAGGARLERPGHLVAAGQRLAPQLLMPSHELPAVAVGVSSEIGVVVEAEVDIDLVHDSHGRRGLRHQHQTQSASLTACRTLTQGMLWAA